MAAISGPPRFFTARMPVGEVTLISVKKPSITSMPTKSSPPPRRRRARAGPGSALRGARARRRAEPGADFALAVGQVGGLGHAAAYHVGAQIVGRRHPVDRAGEFAVDQNDALVAVLHRGQEFLHHPRLAG